MTTTLKTAILGGAAALIAAVAVAAMAGDSNADCVVYNYEGTPEAWSTDHERNVLLSTLDSKRATCHDDGKWKLLDWSDWDIGDGAPWTPVSIWIPTPTPTG